MGDLVWFICFLREISIYPAMYILLYVSTYFSHVAIYTVAHLSIHLYRR